MEVFGWLLVVAWLAFIAGRISPEPLGELELKLRRRAFEWRVWWIDKKIAQAEQRKQSLVEWHEKEAR